MSNLPGDMTGQEEFFGKLPPSFRAERAALPLRLKETPSPLTIVAEGIDRIAAMILELPSGIDAEANPEDESPEDATAHVGGLIWQELERIRPLLNKMCACILHREFHEIVSAAEREEAKHE